MATIKERIEEEKQKDVQRAWREQDRAERDTAALNSKIGKST